jgi:hypothetical protein
LVIGTPERFGCGKQVASYLGLIPGEASSADHWRLGHITKQGNKLLRSLLGQSAQSVARCEEQWHRQYAHLTMRPNKLIAKVAMARKLAVRLFWMWRKGWAFGVLAAILAAVGLYGVMAYMVARRTNEIGIRMALGAAPIQMLEMVLGEAGKLCGVGVAVGIVVTLAIGRWAASLLFGLKPYDPAMIATACLGLAAVAVLASTVPARRAAKLLPMVALREA